MPLVPHCSPRPAPHPTIAVFLKFCGDNWMDKPPAIKKKAACEPESKVPTRRRPAISQREASLTQIFKRSRVHFICLSLSIYTSYNYGICATDMKTVGSMSQSTSVLLLLISILRIEWTYNVVAGIPCPKTIPI